MAYVAPTTRATSNVIGAAEWNANTVDNVKWLASDAPKCRTYRVSSQTIPNATQTDLQWDTNAYDNASIHSTAVNPQRLTIPSTGYYRLMCGISFPGMNGTLMATLTKNGAGVPGARVTQETSGLLLFPSLGFFYEDYFTAADYLTVGLYHNAGGPTNFGDYSWVTLAWFGV